ncbi:MAG: sugar transferase [Cytophagales bacterium]|nr:MAG: sugar transferase [Cytophagales bacterium]
MSKQLEIAYINSSQFSRFEFQSFISEEIKFKPYESLEVFFQDKETHQEIDALLIAANITLSSGIDQIKAIKIDPVLRHKSLLICGSPINKTTRALAMELKVDDFILAHSTLSDIIFRIKYIVPFKNRVFEQKFKQIVSAQSFKIPLNKRIFDIVFASTVLICLSPLFIIVGILIKLSSKGPVFYSSKRVGAGYKAFDFYKFRSMVPDADKRLKDITHLNQYNLDREDKAIESTNTLCSECIEREVPCQAILFKDGDAICERLHKIVQKDLNGAAFLKVKDDPRITMIGKFIRDSSIDELPQLFNVLKGDMSIVGNRPLPIYEAEKITTDQFITRFMAPAGITGLWQVNKRGKGKMSQEERIELDNIYANNYSLAGDIKIILKTIPALLQKESV